MFKKTVGLLLSTACVIVLSVGMSYAETGNPALENQGDSIEEYNKMLSSFKTLRSAEAYPDYYAGSYVDDDGELVVLVKEDTADNIATIKLLTSNPDIQTKKAHYSLNELKGVKNEIAKYFDMDTTGATKEIVDSIVGVGTDEMNNRVNVCMENLSEEKIAAFKILVSDSEMVTFENDDQYRLSASRNLGSGVTLSGSKGSGSLSIGFRAQKIVNGKAINGFVTACHGYYYANDAKAYELDSRDPLGTVYAAHFGQMSDAAFVGVTNGDSISSTVGGTGKILVGNHYYEDIPVNATVYKYGITTKETSGKVKENDFSFKVDGVNFGDMVRTTAKADEGDSGGITYTYVNGDYIPDGVVMANNILGSMIYSKLSNIIVDLDITPY